MNVRLLDIAHARSGDKGDTANVGLIALEPDYYPILQREVTVARVARHFKGMVTAVERFELPNLNALNFLLHGALDGGGTISLKTDAQGKVKEWRAETNAPVVLQRRGWTRTSVKPGEEITKEEIVEFLDGRVAKWWLPDDVVFIDEVPKTSVGKFSKKDLRDRFADYELPT